MSFNLDNDNKTLLTGLVDLLRDNVNGWSTSDEYGVDNVWPKGFPDSVEDEFPRATLDITAGNDFELSVDLDVKLRETTVKLVVFSDSSGDVETLVDEAEDAITKHWDSTNSEGDPYIGDWSFRETDGFTPLVENNEEKNKLRYNRSEDFTFEVVKAN